MNKTIRKNIINSMIPLINLYVKRIDMNFGNANEMKKYIKQIEIIMDFIDDKKMEKA